MASQGWVTPLSTGSVLVTGGSGFLGSHLTRRLVTEGADVHVLTSRVSSIYPWRLLDVRPHIRLHEVNLTDTAAVEAVVASVGPAHVFHLAAYTHVGKSWQRVDECLQTNVQGTVTLLRALDGGTCERFTQVSTSDVYGEAEASFGEDTATLPTSPYAVSKLAAEAYCRMFHRTRGWPIVVLRPFNTYGPAQTPDRIIPETVVRALRGTDLAMTEGTQTREFNYVDDVVGGIVAAASTPGIEGHVFNLGCEDEVSIRDVVKLVLDLTGNTIEARFGALPERPGEIPRMVSDSRRARERLGWAPQVSLTDGLERTIGWYRHQLASSSSPFEL